MRVLVLSHACVLAANQRPYARLVHDHGIDLTLVAPARWASDLHGPLALAVLPALAGRVVGATACWPGQRALHWYGRGLPDVQTLRPDLVLADEEPWSLAALQALLLARRAGARFVFATKQHLAKRLLPPFGSIRPLVLRQADAAIALTEPVQQVLRAQGYHGPIAIIPHGIEVTCRAQAPTARRRVGAPPGR